MRRFNYVLTTVGAAAVLFCLHQSALAYQAPTEDGAKLGAAQSDLPPLPAPPKSRPKSTAPDEAKRETVPKDLPQRPARPRLRRFDFDVPPAPAPAERTADEHAAAAKQLIEEGRYDVAIQAASLAIAADPENSEYLKIRANAYQLIGRYEQALADTKPLDVVVAVRQAKLKSANEVVAVVPKGALLNVTEVKGNWLKVASVGDENFKWAWVHKSSLVQGRRPPMPLPQRIIVQPIPPADFYGRYYGGLYYDLGRRSGYGRAYYDWTRHVPTRYWRYLPW